MRLAIVLSLFAPGCSGTAEKQAPPEPLDDPSAEPAAAEAQAEAPPHVAMFGVVPDHMFVGSPAADSLVSLGRMLYFENRISKNHDLSCNSCHRLDLYGVDNEATSPGHKGQRGARNSPTVYNAAAHVAQFWDGRAADVEEQAKGPVLNPVEMAMPDAEHVLTVLKSIPAYEKAFAEAFPGEADAITYDNFGKAIGAFERGLVTKNARFDQYAAGSADALTEEEVAGLDLFVSTGCTTCHSGALFGGQLYQKLGLVHPYETADAGRFEVTKQEADRFMFKVPSLRNVTRTGPWYHDGSITALDDAVRKMAHHQLGKDLTDEEVAKIVGFLDTLTGELPTDYIAAPTLPESGPETPGPDPT
jgi:cytochrome c peroxidase